MYSASSWREGLAKRGARARTDSPSLCATTVTCCAGSSAFAASPFTTLCSRTGPMSVFAHSGRRTTRMDCPSSSIIPSAQRSLRQAYSVHCDKPVMERMRSCVMVTIICSSSECSTTSSTWRRSGLRKRAHRVTSHVKLTIGRHLLTVTHISHPGFEPCYAFAQSLILTTKS